MFNPGWFRGSLRPEYRGVLLALPGLAALVWEPALWLLRSWRDPSYQSDGVWIAVLTAGLLAVSVWSGPAAPHPRQRLKHLGWTLLVATAGVRLAGRLLDINALGALALVVDVGAIAVLLGVARRPIALHPAWLAAFFAAALPLEHLAQRLLGHPLQLLAARGAEALLRPVFPALQREGVLLLHPDVALAIDLPCSGARGLVLLTSIALFVAATRCLTRSGLVRGVGAVAIGAFAANTLRIIGLFVGSAQGLPVVEEPLHSALGALALAVGAFPLLSVARSLPARRVAVAEAVRCTADAPPVTASLLGRLPWRAALAVGVVGIAVSAAPQRPLDRRPQETLRRLPTTLDALASVALPLRDAERRYFEVWGGAVEKRVYDDAAGLPHTALLVRTRSPLRHLHGPDRCLVGAGHEVTRIGVVAGALPTVLYRSLAPDGQVWRVESSFVNARGARATTVSEVVWHWLGDREAEWSLLQRVTPWELCERHPKRCAAFDRALLTALDQNPEAIPLPRAATLQERLAVVSPRPATIQRTK